MPDEISRRQLLKLGGAGVAGAAASTLLPPSVYAALARAPKPGGLRALRHVVILMQENRSFDHYFGMLRGVRGYGDRNAVTLRTGRSVFEQPVGPAAVMPYSIRGASERGAKLCMPPAVECGQDPNYMGGLFHDWNSGHLAWADGWYDNWAVAKTPATMAHYDREDLPFTYQLADAFTVCDAYHASHIGPTGPNRCHLFTGMIGYEPTTGLRAIENDAYDEDNHAGYSWTTYAERLEQAGKSWQVYHEWDNFQDNALEVFVPFKELARTVLAPVGDYKSMNSFYNAVLAAEPAARAVLLEKLAQSASTLGAAERSVFDRGLQRVEAGGLARSFRADVEAGRLPQVSYIVPSSAESDHPSGSSPAASAKMVYEILDAIASDPDVWDSTALFINYDENDGLFDHMPPPVPPAEHTDEYVNGWPIGLGVRVPMVVVSPWTVGGYVCSQVFDHTSVLRFTEQWLGVPEPNISAWRRQVCGDLTAAFDFGTRSRAVEMTAPGPVPPDTGRWFPLPPVDQKLPVPEAGVRKARPLPYQPDASAAKEQLTLRVSMNNTGAASAHFTLYPGSSVLPYPLQTGPLYPYLSTLTAPRHFDVLGSEDVTVPLGPGGYGLTLIGPNGFRREFSGGIADVAGLTTTIDPGQRTLALKLTNGGLTDLTYAIVANAYGAGERRISVPAGGTRTTTWDTTTVNGWYDVTVTVPGMAKFSRRLAGHIENGEESISG